VPASVRVSRVVFTQILEHARSNPGQECCGLLAGKAASITHIFPARNILASSTAYEIAPAELFTLFREMRAAALECTGIYHSHPRGDNTPSGTDLKLAYYPDAAYFIVSPLPDAAKPVRAFRIYDRGFSEMEIAIVE
jgi:proteasome lid subunit RPN8/RPN11